MNHDNEPLWPHMVNARQLDQFGASKVKQEAQIKAELEEVIEKAIPLQNILVRRPDDGLILTLIFEGELHELDLSGLKTKPQVGALLMQLGATLCR